MTQRRKRRRTSHPNIIPQPNKKVRFFPTEYLLMHLDDVQPNSYWIGKILEKGKKEVKIEYYYPNVSDPTIWKKVWLKNGKRVKTGTSGAAPWIGHVCKKGGGILSKRIRLDSDGRIANKKSIFRKRSPAFWGPGCVKI